MFYTHKTTVEATKDVMEKNRKGDDVNKQKKIKENWLVRGVNLTDIETQLTQVYSEMGECSDFRIVGTKEENFLGVVISEDGGEKWFKITVAVEYENENGGTKVEKENWLVQAETIDYAQETLIREKYSDFPFINYVVKSSEEQYAGILNWDLEVNEYAD